MTALKEYERLECQALWRAAQNAQRREVLVTFGDASLMIADQNEVALAHWSLPAIRRLNAGASPALYSPSAEAGETLEIVDEAMIAAIEKVRGAIARTRPQPGRLRMVLLALVVAAIAALAVFWLPGALVRHTVGVVPAAKRAEIGQQLLADVTYLTGKRCHTPLGAAALTQLKARLGLTREQLLVFRDGVPGSAHLPGGFLLLDASLVEDHEGPQVVAAHIVLERLRAETTDPLARLLEHAGVLTTLRLLTTGDIAPDVLKAYAEAALTAPPDKVPEVRLLDELETAGVPSTPYAFALDATGETTFTLIEADPYRARRAPPILSDGTWVSLQGICGE